MKNKLITIRINEQTYRQLKQYCIDNHTTISKLILDFVYTKLENVYTNSSKTSIQKPKRIDKCIDKTDKRIDKLDSNKLDIY